MVELAYAQGANAAQPSPFGPLLLMVAMFVVFYLIVIRPQQKRHKEHQAMLGALQRGDEVVTQGGLHGKIVGLTDEVVTMEAGSVQGGKQDDAKVRLKVDRQLILRKRQSTQGG